jgi:hypothetical protein
MMRLMRARIAYRAEPVEGKYRGPFWANTALIFIQAQLRQRTDQAKLITASEWGPPEERKTPDSPCRSQCR